MKKITLNILSIILLLTIILEITYISLATSITPSSIKESIKTNLLTGFIYDDSGNKTAIFNTILKLTKLDEKTVIKLMENESANKIITDIVGSIYDYNLTQDKTYKYTKSEIIELVENNIDKILLEIDYNISTNDREYAINYTKNNIDYIINTIYNTDIGEYKKW